MQTLSPDVKVRLPNPLDEEFGDSALPQLADTPPVREVRVREHSRSIPTPFIQEIDLGDGSGKQVFKAASQGELIEILAEAQKNATLKIRELTREAKLGKTQTQQQRVKKTAVTLTQPKQLSADEEFLLGQDLSHRPVEAFDRLFEARLGFKPDRLREIAAKVTLYDQMVAAQDETAKFLTAHTDFLVTPGNMATMQQFLDNEGLAINQDNLDFAFKELSTSGLLDTKVIPAVVPASDPEPEPQRRQVNTALSSRRAAAPQRRDDEPGEPDADELRSLSLDEARDRIVRAYHSQRRG